MTILTKTPVLKGVAATFTLSKSELAAHALVAANPYFSDMLNWKKVVLSYVSSIGNQKETVSFDATQSGPTAMFLVSDRAQDIFVLQHISIVDFDGGFIRIPSSQLDAFTFNVSFLTLGSFDFFSSPNSLVASGSGVINNSNLNGHAIITEGNRLGNNFDYTFSISGMNNEDCFQLGLSQSPNSITTSLRMFFSSNGGGPQLAGRFPADIYGDMTLRTTFNSGSTTGGMAGPFFSDWMAVVNPLTTYTFRFWSTSTTGMHITISDGITSHTYNNNTIADHVTPVYPFVLFPTTGNLCVSVIDNLA